MSVNTKTPMALYKANLELVLRIGTLLQENRQRWMQAGAAGSSEAIQRTLSETERMLTTNDWTSLSAMPGEEFWKSLRGGAGPLQGTVESAVHSQAEFAEGLKQAFVEWQQQSADALGGSAAQATPWAFTDPMQGFNAPSRSSTSTKDNEVESKAKSQARPSTPSTGGAKGKASSKKGSRAAKPGKPAKK